MAKTNAVRLLESAGIDYSAHEYDISDGVVSGTGVAAKIRKEPERVFKTLVTKGPRTGINVFIIPSNAELDMKKAAVAAGDKHVEMIKLKELEPTTGYVHGGCSPIGMKKRFPTYIDETAGLFDTIVISGGRLGLQLELSPNDVTAVTGALFSDLF
ncbi:MAG: Cys-tRNA(Pro) deacylase [Oscillospiraceae bacterium]|nr:Cys-tRNA(Pro) deacylase [Oscillospiraceae bacterium]